jgi:hypothetical protein
MAISKRYDISGNPIVFRNAGSFDARSYSTHPTEEVWPIRRAVWFWMGLSAAGWIVFAGLVS